jgi:hypothetical protein
MDQTRRFSSRAVRVVAVRTATGAIMKTNLGAPGAVINFCVADLQRLRAELEAESVQREEKLDDQSDGRFGWIMDPEGHRIELWEAQRRLTNGASGRPLPLSPLSCFPSHPWP